MITLNKWLYLFNNKIKYSDFLLNAVIKKSNGTLVKLSDELKIGNVDIIFINKLLSILENKEVFLKGFYDRNLKIYDYHIDELCLNNGKYPKYKNVIRNMYYREILQTTKTIQPNIRSYLDIILDLFNHMVIDYKLITPSGREMIINNKFSSVLSSFYFKASIMNPIIPYTLSRTLDYNFKVFTPTLGWSSYLIGMMSNDYLKEYVGVDVIKKVCSNTEKIANNNNIKNKIYCCPSEDLYHNKSFMKKYSSYFDFIFFSPPYYELELYKGELQSTNQYKTYEEWLDKYWNVTMKMCYSILNDNKYLMYIISGYYLNKGYVNLEKDLTNITKKNGFKYVKKIDMKGKNIGTTKHRESNEGIYIFVKNKKGNDKLIIKNNC